MDLISVVSDNSLSTPGNIFIEQPENGYTVPITVKSGQVLERGTPMAKQTADGLYYKLDLTASDGTETLVGILVDDVDSTDEDTVGEIYLHGSFNKTKLPNIANYASSPLLEGAYNHGMIIIKEAEY